jgi:hypothetical protein
LLGDPHLGRVGLLRGYLVVEPARSRGGVPNDRQRVDPARRAGDLDPAAVVRVAVGIKSLRA